MDCNYIRASEVGIIRGSDRSDLSVRCTDGGKGRDSYRHESVVVFLVREELAIAGGHVCANRTVS